MKTKNMTTLHLRKSIGRSPLRFGFPLIPLVLACFALLPSARAISPPPDGCYGSGVSNTAEGCSALEGLTTGGDNTALGLRALNQNTTGNYNTATGANALDNNNGSANTANGAFALHHNESGAYNTANGFGALLSNTTGNANTAVGFNALHLNNGSDNTATGYQALYSNNGVGNTACGVQALKFNTSGADNTAIGSVALLHTTGSNNIGVGNAAGSALTTGSNNIVIGNPGLAGDSNTIRIGISQKLYIEPIMAFDASGGFPVYILNGQLGIGPVCPPQCMPSSERFKDDIERMDKASEAILALQPVTFRYKKEFDPKGIPQFGLVAEEVQKVNPDLVVRDPHGKPYGVRYEAVNAMLLNEFLKEHRTVQELKKEVAALTAGLQKVSTQLEASKPAPQVVNNP
jgi:hypothetical protein